MSASVLVELECDHCGNRRSANVLLTTEGHVGWRGVSKSYGPVPSRVGAWAPTANTAPVLGGPWVVWWRGEERGLYCSAECLAADRPPEPA